MNKIENRTPSKGALAPIDPTIVVHSLGSWIIVQYENKTLDIIKSVLV